jgi:hypothetical protein
VIAFKSALWLFLDGRHDDDLAWLWALHMPFSG